MTTFPAAVYDAIVETADRAGGLGSGNAYDRAGRCKCVIGAAHAAGLFPFALRDPVEALTNAFYEAADAYFTALGVPLIWVKNDNAVASLTPRSTLEWDARFRFPARDVLAAMGISRAGI